MIDDKYHSTDPWLNVSDNLFLVLRPRSCRVPRPIPTLLARCRAEAGGRLPTRCLRLVQGAPGRQQIRPSHGQRLNISNTWWQQEVRQLCPRILQIRRPHSDQVRFRTIDYY